MPRIIAVLFACFILFAGSAMAQTTQPSFTSTSQRTWTKAERKAFYNNLIALRLVSSAMHVTSPRFASSVNVCENGRMLSRQELERKEIDSCVADVMKMRKLRDKK